MYISDPSRRRSSLEMCARVKLKRPPRPSCSGYAAGHKQVKSPVAQVEHRVSPHTDL